MGLTEGCLNVLFFIQSYICPPVQLDKYTLEMRETPEHILKNHKISWDNFRQATKILWLIVKWNINLLVCFSIWRNLWLLSFWKQHKDLEQLGYYMLLFAITAIARESYIALETYSAEVCFILTQRFKLVPAVPLGKYDTIKYLLIFPFGNYFPTTHISKLNLSGWPSMRRKPKIELQELLVYGLACAGIAFPFIFGAIPIFRHYDPYQLIAQKLISFNGGLAINKYTLKVFSSVICTITAFYGGFVVFFLLFLILIFVEAIQKLSHNLYDRRLKPIIPTTDSKNEVKYEVNKLKLSVNKEERKAMNSLVKPKMRLVMKIATKFQFSYCLRLFRVLDILTRIGNSVISKFLCVLVGMGVLAATWGGFVMLMCYSKFPLILYLSCSLILPIAITINFLLITLGAIPNRNGKNFKQFWKRYLQQKLDLLQLDSCPTIGYSFGPIRKVQEKTALYITDTILNGTATICLMRMNTPKIRF